MTYQTQPGTIPHRVVEFLKENPGLEFATIELCEQLQIGDPGSFTTLMATARRNGVVKAATRPGVRSNFWSLGDGKPEPLPHDFEPDRPLRPAPAQAPEPALATSVPAPAPARFNAALFIDGSLQLIGVRPSADGTVVLAREHVVAVKGLIAALA